MRYDKKELIKIGNEFLNGRKDITMSNMSYKQCKIMDKAYDNMYKSAYTQVNKPINSMDLSKKVYSKKTMIKGGLNEY